MATPPALNEDQTENKVFNLLVKLLLSSLVALFLSQIRLDYFEALLYDFAVRTRPTSTTSDSIRLVLIDSHTIEALKGAPNAAEFSRAIQNLKAAGAQKILIDVLPQDFDGTSVEKENLAQILVQSGAIVLTDTLEQKGEEKKLILPTPFEKVIIKSAPKTSDNKIFAKDGVTRRMLVSYQDQEMLYPELAKDFDSEFKIANLHGSFSFLGSEQLYVDFHPTGFYPRTSFSDWLDPRNDSDFKLKNKIVILGFDNQRTSEEYVLTPYSRELMAMPRSEMHANMIDTVLQNSAVKLAPSLVNFLLTLIVSMFTVYIVMVLRPVRGLAILGATFVALTCFSWISLVVFRFWIATAPPLLALFIVYYFFIPYRLIKENRRSWEYYQKNKLLSQVEELKTNFISMMSHDLKTPIARIKGMVEIIERDKSPLSQQQREALDTIANSSDELLRFISSILEYGKIESQQIELQLLPKDVNVIVEEVINRHEFLAKLKKISIYSELEPLFPLPVDANLLRQVFSNLIENAIKYSHEGTRILVTSEEVDGKILIQVSDQGPGIPDTELNNIFMKFFRSKNAKSSPIKGTGLGLYLAKYFTELHGGQIYVESSLGQGSTFTVELPLRVVTGGGTNAQNFSLR